MFKNLNEEEVNELAALKISNLKNYGDGIVNIIQILKALERYQSSCKITLTISLDYEEAIQQDTGVIISRLSKTLRVVDPDINVIKSITEEEFKHRINKLTLKRKETIQTCQRELVELEKERI